MDFIRRKFKYKQKQLQTTTPKMVITGPKLEEVSSGSSKCEFELEETIPLQYCNRLKLDSNQSHSNSNDNHSYNNCNNIRHQSHHSSHYSLNSSHSRSSGSSDGPEPKTFDPSLLTKILLGRPVVVKRDCFDGDLIHSNDNSFAIDCLYWHNIFRAKHGSPPLTLSYSLINMAQEWANYLAHTDSFKYRNTEGVGENLMSKWTCHPDFDPGGEFIVRFWYSEITLYNYSIDPSLLHTLANHFTQIVWKSTKEFGIGKAHTRGGKLIVVANYRPSGNLIGQFHENVLPPIKDNDKIETERKKSYNHEDIYSLNEQSMNTQSLLNP